MKINRLHFKMLSASVSEWLRPLTSHTGHCPWSGPHWCTAATRQTSPVIGSHSRARIERQRSGSFFDPCVYCSTETLLTVIPYSKQFVAIIMCSFKLDCFWPGLCHKPPRGSLRRFPRPHNRQERGTIPHFPLL